MVTSLTPPPPPLRNEGSEGEPGGPKDPVAAAVPVVVLPLAADADVVPGALHRMSTAVGPAHPDARLGPEFGSPVSTSPRKFRKEPLMTTTGSANEI